MRRRRADRGGTEKAGTKISNHVWFCVKSNWSVNDRDSSKYHCPKSGCCYRAIVLPTPPKSLLNNLYSIASTSNPHKPFILLVWKTKKKPNTPCLSLCICWKWSNHPKTPKQAGKHLKFKKGFKTVKN